jgi:hypothetical protein
MIEPEFKVRLFARVSVPLAAAPVPPKILAPELIVTAPPIVPVPPRVVPLLFTVTGPVPVPEPVALFTSRVPPLTVVPPLYVFAPESLQIPVPLFINATVPVLPEPLPEIMPDMTPFPDPASVSV